MDTSAYDRGLPCLNPHCKSHGVPHSNCRCYMAEGGVAGHFCATDNPHQEGCPYYMADGGEIPDDQVQVDPAPPAQAEEEIPADQVKVDAPSDEIPDDQVQLDTPPLEGTYPGLQEYLNTPLGKVATAIQGAGEGILGPLATFIEKSQGFSNPDIKAAEQVNPITYNTAKIGSMVGSMLTGTGETGLIAKGAEAIPEVAALGKMGSQALRLFVQGASFAGSDEITKSLLGQGDPEHAVAAALLGGVANTAMGGMFNLFGKGLEQIGSEAIVDKAERFLAKFAEGTEAGAMGTPVSSTVAKGIQGYLASKLPFHSVTGDLFSYDLMKKWLYPQLEKITGRTFGKLDDYANDAIINALLKENTFSIPTVMRYGRTIAQGMKSTLPAIEALFKSGTSKEIVPRASDALLEAMHQNVEEGTPQLQMQDQLQKNNGVQGFAEGGEVAEPETNHFANVYPEHNVLLNQAKGRIYQYLNAIRPLPDAQKLPFDEPIKDSDKERSYKKALHLAVNPLHILNHIHRGDLTPEDMQHFTSLYPEVHRFLAKKLTDRIFDAQMNDEKPKYGKRQAMSLFLGTPLDSSMTPESIQAAQMSFASKAMRTPQPQQSKKKPSGSKASLGKSAASYFTDDQARIQRSQRARA